MRANETLIVNREEHHNRGSLMKISKHIKIFLIAFIFAILILIVLAACGPSEEDLNSVDYAPLAREDWPVSTPEEQGLDSRLVSIHRYISGKLA